MRKSCENRAKVWANDSRKPLQRNGLRGFLSCENRAKIVRTVYSIYFLAACGAVFFVARGGDRCRSRCRVFGLGPVLSIEVVKLVVDGALMVSGQGTVLAQEILLIC